MFLVALWFSTTMIALRAQPRGSLSAKEVESRANALLAKLTLEQKIDLLGGTEKFYIRAVPEIGLPRLRMSDGPMGVREWGRSTAYPGGMALAATWDPKLAEEIGAAMGADARARGVSLLLAPGVNLSRAPIAGRNFEYFGEDPLLASRIAVGFIRGVQRQGIIATIKHLAANNQEFNRVEVSSDIDERTLRELYLPVFEAAVKEGHVGAVMDAYNPVNGQHPTENANLNCDILKKEWKFDGILMSDWGGTHHGIAAANSCLDLEMPSPEYMNRSTLLPAIQEGKVSIQTIDDKVRRILRKEIEFGLLDRPETDLRQALYSQKNRDIALKGALEGAVLLKNENSVLPLDKSRIRRLAVLGPNATPAVYGGGGSSKVTPYETVSTLQGLMNYLEGTAEVQYDRALPELGEVSKQCHFTYKNSPGAWLEIFDNATFAGSPVKSFMVDNIEPGALATILKPDNTLLAGIKALRFHATYSPQHSGRHLFLTSAGGSEFYASGQDQYRLAVNGKQVASVAPFEQQAPLATYLELSDTKPLEIQFDYVPASPRAYPRLAIGATDDLISERAKQIARDADAVVLTVGFDASTEREGMDRSFELPFGQEDLIRTISALNRRTIVVLNGGGAIDMHRWMESTPAILDALYPGQEGGAALPRILFGEHNPSGKLPFSMDRTWESSPVFQSYSPVKRKADDSGEGTFPFEMAGANRIGKIDRGVLYSEGLLNGYRYYSGSSVKPLFPFGFGLSYTTFRFENLRLGAVGENGVSATVAVTNTGTRQGEEVVQLYVGLPSTQVPMPAKQLKAFEKISLRPQETARVELHLDRRALSYYDVSTHNWKLASGEAKVFVGGSSEDTPLTKTFTVPR